MTPKLPARLTPPERAVVHFPDRSTTWAILLCAELTSDIDDDQLASRLRLLQEAAPITGARLRGSTWVAGAELVPVAASTPDDLLSRFDLANEPPLRVAHWGSSIALSGHHAAFDGLALVSALRLVLGLAVDPHRRAPPAAAAAGFELRHRRSALATLIQPVSRVAPSPSADADARGARLIRPRPQLTAAIARAAAESVVDRNRRLHVSTDRLGITIGVGGTEAVANDASYRRVDVSDPSDVGRAVQAALASPSTPGLFRLPSPILRLLAPVAHRFSDTFLVSNLGRLELPGVSRVEFYPVARGRSAVAFGAAGVAGGPSTLTIRARDLDQRDAELLLDDVVRRLEAGEG